jgi:hypothetical protein
MLLDVATAFEKARKALASRHLFDNWPSLLIKYALLRLGFDVKLIAKINDCALKMTPEAFERFVSRFSRGLVKSIECIDGRVFVNGVKVGSIDDAVHNMEVWARAFGWTMTR